MSGERLKSCSQKQHHHQYIKASESCFDKRQAEIFKFDKSRSNILIRGLRFSQCKDLEFGLLIQFFNFLANLGE